MDSIQNFIKKIIFERNHMNNTLRNKLKNDTTKAVIFDIDGTLTEAKWGAVDAVAMPWDKCTPSHYEHRNDNTWNITPIPVMQEFVKSINKPKYVLSGTHDSIEDRLKNKMLNTSYPSIKEENRYFTRTVEDKIEILKCIAKDKCKSDKDCIIYVDDCLPDIFTIKKAFVDVGCADAILCYHV